MTGSPLTDSNATCPRSEINVPSAYAPLRRSIFRWLWIAWLTSRRLGRRSRSKTHASCQLRRTVSGCRPCGTSIASGEATQPITARVIGRSGSLEASPGLLCGTPRSGRSFFFLSNSYLDPFNGPIPGRLLPRQAALFIPGGESEPFRRPPPGGSEGGRTGRFGSWYNVDTESRRSLKPSACPRSARSAAGGSKNRAVNH